MAEPLAADEAPNKLANGHSHAPASSSLPGSPRDSSATANCAAELQRYGSDVSDFVREDDPDAAEPDAQQQLQQALERIAQLEDQNVALWQELQSGDGSGGSSDAGSPKSRDAGSRHGSDGGAVAAAKARDSHSQGELDAKRQELSFLQQRCMQFEVEVEQEFEELNAQLFKAQQKVHELQQLLNESESKRRQLESAKLMVEAKLQETGQQLMECEQQLANIGSRGGSSKSGSKDGGKSGEDGKGTATEGDKMESPGTPPTSARRTGTPFFNSILENELEQVKEENEGLIGQLMLKKMDLAELSENYSKVKRDLHRREAKDRAAQQKMSRLSAILGSDMSRMRSSSGKSQSKVVAA